MPLNPVHFLYSTSAVNFCNIYIGTNPMLNANTINICMMIRGIMLINLYQVSNSSLEVLILQCRQNLRHVLMEGASVFQGLSILIPIDS